MKSKGGVGGDCIGVLGVWDDHGSIFFVKGVDSFDKVVAGCGFSDSR